MNFGPRHYVPVLKVKRAEKRALGMLSPNAREMVTPLLEIVERNPNKTATIDAQLDNSFRDLAAGLHGTARSFLDAREIATDGLDAARQVFRRAVESGIAFTPVTGVHRTEDVNPALEFAQHGVALRLTRQEFETDALTHGLEQFLNQYGLTPQQTDLILDLGAVDDLIAEGIISLTRAMLDSVPDHTLWRTFFLSASAFPLSMSIVNRLSHCLVARDDWIAWHNALFDQQRVIARLPTFSDCAIQHTKGVEGFDHSRMQVSASIRFTSSTNWLLIKGEGTHQKPPSTQFPGLAQQLVYGHLRSHYSGWRHCAGCSSMKDAADGAPRHGSPEVWRRLRTVHHITTVVQDLVALPWLSDEDARH